MGTVTYEAIVHKANIPLLKGESVSQFMSKLQAAAREHIMKKLNMTAKTGYVYCFETFADATIADVSKRGPTDSDPWTYGYYALPYTRKTAGEFDFGDLVEVERVTSFQPKQPIPLTKGKSKKDMEDLEEEEEEEEEELSKKPKKTAAKKDAPPGWAYTQKSIWAGVV